MNHEVAIVGGGLSGLISSILLIRNGIKVTLIERKKYPFHRVCGEYISNEVVNFLKREGLYPFDVALPQIDHLQLTSTNGKSSNLKLKMGGFGVSRYFFDEFLLNKAIDEGVNVIQGTSVDDLYESKEVWHLKTSAGNEIIAPLVIGAFGKRSKLDKQLNRNFLKYKSPYLGVKYHIEIDHPENQISLHNFLGGYCGMSRVENGIVNLCYMSHRSNLKSLDSIHEMEQKVLFKNPFLEHVFSNAKFLIEKPIVINEISFKTKSPVENGILMIGDSAGMITPLCGNGMAMAIHSAKILSAVIIDNYSNGRFSKGVILKNYSRKWRNQFSRRLFAGRQIQNLFGSEFSSNLAVSLANNFKPIGQWLVNQTHGKPF